MTHTPPPPPQDPHLEHWETTPKQPRRWRRRALHAVAYVAVFVVGTAIGTTAQPEPEVVTQTETVTETEQVEVPGEVPQDELDALAEREQAVAEAESDVAAREEAVAAAEVEVEDREAAVAETEDEVAASSFGDGTHMVGDDIEPGTYTAPGGAFCYWERLSGTSGEFTDIIANDLGDSQHVVTVDGGDVAFSTDGCGEWSVQ